MLAAAFLCSLGAVFSATPTPPAGFRPASDLEILRLFGTSNDDTCYEVTLVNDRVRVETRVGFVARERREQASRKEVEPRHKIAFDSFTGWWSPGDGLKVKDGWLMGWHTSHYGGGLYWFSEDGNSYKKVDARYTRGLAETSTGIFAFQSSAFFELSYSRFVKLKQEDSRWTVHLVTDLHDAPQEILALKDRFIYVGPQYVSTMELDGTQRVIVRSSR